MIRKLASKISPSLIRKIQFATVGVSVLLLGYGVLFFCVEILGLNKSLAYAIQAVVSIEINFVLNYRYTWGDRREGGVWRALKRFHAVRIVTITGNQLLFNSLLSAGVPYLIANTVCVTGTMVFNYIVGDRFTFRATRTTRAKQPVIAISSPASPEMQTTGTFPHFSIIVPVKNNGYSIRDTIEALLRQDYPYAPEIIVVGDRIDRSWDALQDLSGDIQIIKTEITSPGRDSNMKRQLGLQQASYTSDILAVIDGDVVVAPNWMRLVTERLRGEVKAVAGPVRGIGNSFWANYIDHNPTASKTPRINGSFIVDRDTLAHKKPPITANFALTRMLYEEVGGPNVAFTNSYEDYEWFSRIIQAGHGILCDSALSSKRHHREGLRPLLHEYRRSGQGCADHIVTHFPNCPFAVRRVKQLGLLYVACVLGLVALLFAPMTSLLAGIIGISVFSIYTSIRMGRLSALSYPSLSALLSSMFVYGAVRQLILCPQLVAPTLHSLSVEKIGNEVSDSLNQPVEGITTRQESLSIAGVKTRVAKQPAAKAPTNRIFWPIFAIILAAAAALRLWSIGTRPGFDWDESVYQAIGANMTQHGLLQAVPDYGTPAEPYLYHPPFYFLLLRLWFGLFGSGIMQARVLAATGSVIMLALLGLCLRKLIGSKWALLTTGVLAVDGWTVFTNRVGWFENIMMPLGILALWLYTRALKRPTFARFVIVGGILGLVTIFKHVGVYFLLAVLIDWLIRRTNNRKYLALLATSLTVITSYICYVSAAYSTTYWRESTVQIQRVMGLRESRGAVNSFSDLITPLLGQYKIFVLSLLLVIIGSVVVIVRATQMLRQHSSEPLGEHTILFSWAAASLIVFAGMQLKLPHYFIMIIIPMVCLLGYEIQRRPPGHHQAKFLRQGITVAIIGVIIGNLAVFNARIVNRTDNALQQTAQWVDLNVPSDALVLTEESVGSLIDRRYCKFGHAERCASQVQFIITYNSHTQQPPDTMLVRNLLASSTKINEFSGFKERLTIYRVDL
jgi:4-amino-4-deoxy-L-arabinose transferase-like glycosyltransferase/putative flippase GtrA/glycosyltransferase involved in cell wall biosynthesis